MALQFARPTETITQGIWNPYPDQPLWQCLDEETPNDDTDYIESHNNTSTTYVTKLSFAETIPLGSGLIVRWRMYVSWTSAAINCLLYQGSTQIAHLGTKKPIVWTTYEVTLTEAQYSSITDYSDLRLRFIFSPGFATYGYVTWAELQVTDGFNPKIFYF